MTIYVMRKGTLVDKRSVLPLAGNRSVNTISDIEPFMTQEGTAIGSRTALREYERANGVRQVGTDWTGSKRPAFWDRHLTRERAKGR